MARKKESTEVDLRRLPVPVDWDMVDRICGEVSRGRTLTEVCREEWAPSIDEFRRWITRDQEVAKQWSKSRELQSHSLFDEAVELARTVPSATMPQVAARRLTVDTLRWAAGKLAPREYGDRAFATQGVAIQINTTLDLEPKRVEADPLTTVAIEQEPVTRGYKLEAVIPLEPLALAPLPLREEELPLEMHPKTPKGIKKRHAQRMYGSDS